MHGVDVKVIIQPPCKGDHLSVGRPSGGRVVLTHLSETTCRSPHAKIRNVDHRISGAVRGKGKFASIRTHRWLHIERSQRSLGESRHDFAISVQTKNIGASLIRQGGEQALAVGHEMGPRVHPVAVGDEPAFGGGQLIDEQIRIASFAAGPLGVAGIGNGFSVRGPGGRK